KEKADVILNEMEKDFADDVKELLDLPEERAGGLMTTAIPMFLPSLSATEALQKLKEEEEELDLIYYSYIVDSTDNHLGVVSIRDLLIANPDTLLQDIMDDRIIAVNINAHKREIVDCFIKYAIIAIPVVDDDEKLKGAVLLKDIIEIIESKLGK
ncbi:MAG: CBS domain-containing protein, partial [Deltaproteobacteria bacterium]